MWLLHLQHPEPAARRVQVGNVHNLRLLLDEPRLLHGHKLGGCLGVGFADGFEGFGEGFNLNLEVSDKRVWLHTPSLSRPGSLVKLVNAC